MHSSRDGRVPHAGILAVFRAPAGPCVGPTAFEPQRLRAIERAYPEIAFDWATLIGTRQLIEVPPELRRPRRRRRPDEPEGELPESKPGPDAVGTTGGSVPPTPPSFPDALGGHTPGEQIAFLGQWYPRLRDRVAERVTDSVRREALGALAERLNPSAWTDADEIAAGLLAAEEALERLSRVFSRRKRRSRRGRARESLSGATPQRGPDSDTTPSEPVSPKLEALGTPTTDEP